MKHKRMKTIKQVKHKVAIVTGASSGIGFALAKLLIKRGAKVVLVSRSKEKLEKISKSSPNSIYIVADMTKPKEIINMVKKVKEHFGRIDILINNAGQGYDAPIEKINISTFQKIFDLDVIGPIIAMQQVIPIMRKQKEGTIINISSGTALMYLPNMAGYSSLKLALAHISLTAREELKKDKINVSVVYPYITETNFEKNTIKDFVPRQRFDEDALPHPPDSAEYIARKILEGIEDDKPEIFAHQWMKSL
jgi:short-subunit dehydrogenase